MKAINESQQFKLQRRVQVALPEYLREILNSARRDNGEHIFMMVHKALNEYTNLPASERVETFEKPCFCADTTICVDLKTRDVIHAEARRAGINHKLVLAEALGRYLGFDKTFIGRNGFGPDQSLHNQWHKVQAILAAGSSHQYAIPVRL